MSRIQASSSGTKIKIVLGFIVSIGAIVTAAYYAYSSFTQLLDSVETLSTPDQSIAILQNIQGDMIESESSMRNYIISPNEDALTDYEKRMTSISRELDHLKTLPSFQAMSGGDIDTLHSLFRQKDELVYALVDFKTRDNKTVASKAMHHILEMIQEEEGNEVSTTVADNTDAPGLKQTSTDVEALQKEKEELDKKEKKKGIFSRRKDKDDSITVLQVPTIVKIDDTLSQSGSQQELNSVISSNPSLDYGMLRTAMTEIQEVEKQYDTQMTSHEKELLASEKIIYQRIKLLIHEMMQYEQRRMASQSYAAVATARTSSRIILLISVLSLLAGLIFLGIILNDINRGNRYKKNLEIARNKAVELAKAKEEFLANMSHEIRTPLNAIIGFSEQLYSTPLQTQQRSYLNAVQNASSHLLNTVNDILDLSKIEAGKLSFESKPFRIADVIHEVVTVMSIKAREKNLHISSDTDEFCAQYVNGDPFRLKQILYNLIGNAIKFTEEGKIHVSATSWKGERSISYTIGVEDTGIGISADKIASIFENFTQADSGTTRKFGGTGLGLAISKKLIEMQGGKIKAESVENSGSKFTIDVSYKLSSEKEIAEMETDIAHAHGSLRGISVLVVDDEPYNLLLAEIILKKSGAATTCVSNAVHALNEINNTHFDVILADLHMPDFDGVMLAKKIRETDSGVPLIALTANVMQDDHKMIREAGFNDILLKPYKEISLIRKIRAHAFLDTEIPFTEETTEKENNTVAESGMNGFDGHKYFNLSEIREFTDNDLSVILQVMSMFIENNNENMKNLRMYIDQKNTEGVRNTAHKMLPSYNHFKIADAVPLLRKMEVTQNTGDDISSDMVRLESISTHVFAEMETEIKRLNEMITA